jgi:hypothetical protein
VTDGPKRKSAHDEFAADMETQKAVEEGIDVVSEAMKQLLSEPKEARGARLESLITQVRALSERLEAAGDKGEAAERVKAIERVIEIIQHIAEKKE